MARRRTRRDGPKLAAVVLPAMRRAAHVGVDRATKRGLDRQRSAIRAAGLGRLERAVGYTSSLRKRRTSTDNAWGAVFARGRAQSRGNQALLAYSQGASIYPTGNRKWLAFPTKAVPSRGAAGGQRASKMTPEIYRAAGLEQTIGKLVFVQTSPREAVLIARRVNVSRRTGRAKRFVDRVPRGSDRKDVVAFVLIRFTLRAQRFDERRIMRETNQEVPADIAEALAALGAAR